MGATSFLQNERRAAWERLTAQSWTVNRARPDPATQKATQGTQRRRQKLKNGKRRIQENKAPERPNGKTELQEMERAATDYRKTKRQSAKHATP